MTSDIAQEPVEEPGSAESVLEFFQQHSDEITDHLGTYSYLVADSLVFIVLGVLVVYVIHKLAVRFLYSRFGNKRFHRVAIVTLYLMVLVLTAILVLKKIGFDVSMGGPLAILTVLFLAVVAYFLIPFLPKLPFITGQTIEVHGILGTVDSVSTFNTTILKFDGTMAFLPNAMLMATKILNYSYTPGRRIEMNVEVALDCDVGAARSRLLSLLSGHELVLEDPGPAVHVTNANASGVQMTLYAWVENANYLGVRTELWLELVKVCKGDDGFAMSIPRQEVHLRDAR